jgi:hypothetical protein
MRHRRWCHDLTESNPVDAPVLVPEPAVFPVADVVADVPVDRSEFPVFWKTR